MTLFRFSPAIHFLRKNDSRLTLFSDLKNADPFLQHSQAPWSCLCRSWTCREAPQAPRWSWSRWWSAPPQVRLLLPPSFSDAHSIFRTNFDKYHPGYFGKVGMRHFHLTRNQYWRPIINVDKLWSLVPEEEKKGLTEDSEVVPVIDTLRHGYGKVLGNGT